jgi:hypothetical protein
MNQRTVLLAWRAATTALAVTLCVFASAQDKKLTIDELIAHHLDSIGTAQARAAAKNRVVTGTVKLISRVGTSSELDGQAAMASSGVKLRYSMKFPSPQYPGEQFGYDGTKVHTGFLPSGQRSPMSLYLEQQSVLLRDGLLGGTISTAWAMLRIEQLKPKLEYRGIKKVEGQQLHEVSYRGQKGSSDLKVSLFFDLTTFQHVRTVYEFKVPARLGLGPNDSTRLQEDYYQFTEEFGDFRAVDALMVPHKYRLQLNVQTYRGSNVFDWNTKIEQVMHNQALDDQIFSK